MRASTTEEAFELSVANAGEPITQEAMERLFQPFTRAREHTSRDELGLGLYIASQIALAHGRTLTVRSSPEETRFTLLVPSGN